MTGRPEWHVQRLARCRRAEHRCSSSCWPPPRWPPDAPEAGRRRPRDGIHPPQRRSVPRPRRLPPSRRSRRWSGHRATAISSAAPSSSRSTTPHPDGPTIGIAVARHPAEDPAARIGSLVINPGGPGVSGIDDMANELGVADPATARRLRHRHLRPPRGPAQRSGDLRERQQAAALRTPYPPRRRAGGDHQGPAAVRADCEKASAAVLPYVGTVDVARDLERLRLALGDPG